MDKLAQESIDEKLAEFPDWSSSAGALQRTFSFDTFAESMTFVSRIARLAEKLRHHPDILIRYNKVTLTLTTHDAGGITDEDFAFATETNSCLEAAKVARNR